jgi:DNA-directed RNA polymerase specialized sigma24 family protein
MEKQGLFAKITDEYSAKILNWAVKKTGSRPDGEDLAQEVLLQVFSAVLRQDRIEKLERFIWKS